MLRIELKDLLIICLKCKIDNNHTPTISRNEFIEFLHFIKSEFNNDIKVVGLVKNPEKLSENVTNTFDGLLDYMLKQTRIDSGKVNNTNFINPIKLIDVDGDKVIQASFVGNVEYFSGYADECIMAKNNKLDAYERIMEIINKYYSRKTKIEKAVPIFDCNIQLDNKSLLVGKFITLRLLCDIIEKCIQSDGLSRVNALYGDFSSFYKVISRRIACMYMQNKNLVISNVLDDAPAGYYSEEAYLNFQQLMYCNWGDTDEDILNNIKELFECSKYYEGLNGYSFYSFTIRFTDLSFIEHHHVVDGDYPARSDSWYDKYSSIFDFDLCSYLEKMADNPMALVVASETNINIRDILQSAEDIVKHIAMILLRAEISQDLLLRIRNVFIRDIVGLIFDKADTENIIPRAGLDNAVAFFQENWKIFENSLLEISLNKDVCAVIKCAINKSGIVRDLTPTHK